MLQLGLRNLGLKSVNLEDRRPSRASHQHRVGILCILDFYFISFLFHVLYGVRFSTLLQGKKASTVFFGFYNLCKCRT